MDLMDCQADWKKIVNKGYQDYGSLTRPERVWFNVQGLIGDVDNGGLVSFYYNHGADYVYETIEDLVLIGKNDIAHLLERMNAFFPNCNLKDIDERNEAISNWEDGDDLLDELDQEFFEKEADLEETLVNYIINNKLLSEKPHNDFPGAQRNRWRQLQKYLISLKSMFRSVK